MILHVFVLLKNRPLPGMLNPKEVKKETVHPKAVKLHQFLWRKTRKHSRGDDEMAETPLETRKLAGATNSLEAKTQIPVQPDEGNEPLIKSFVPTSCP